MIKNYTFIALVRVHGLSAHGTNAQKEKLKGLLNMNNDLQKELALLLTLGFVALKTTPYGLIKKNPKLDIGLENFKNLKKMNVYELLARYQFIDIKENEERRIN